MSIPITDNHHKLTIQLTTQYLHSSSYYFILKVYRKNNSTKDYYHTKRTDNNDGTNTYTFTIPFKDFQIGDEITKMEVRTNTGRGIIEMAEGVTILIDGNETNVQKVESGESTAVLDSKGSPIMVNPIKGHNRFIVNFPDTEPHTVQAIYKGNDEVGVAISDKLYVKAKQAVNTGRYTLTSKIPKTFKYMDTPDWTWTLKLNGTPVPNKTIEKVLPSTTYSSDTNAKGQVHQGLPTSLAVLAKWTVGTYTIIANFYHYNDPNDETTKTLVQCKNTLKIVKNTPTLKFKESAGKGKDFAIGLRDPQGQGMPNKNIILNVNGKKYTKKTNVNGNVRFKTNVKGRYKGSATFVGDANYNKATIKFNQVIR